MWRLYLQFMESGWRKLSDVKSDEISGSAKTSKQEGAFGRAMNNRKSNHAGAINGNGTALSSKLKWSAALFLFVIAFAVHGVHLVNLIKSLPLEEQILRSSSDRYEYSEVKKKGKQTGVRWMVHNPEKADQSLYRRIFEFDAVEDGLGLDFFQYYVSGIRLLNGRSIYLDDEIIPWMPRGSYNRYPPLVAAIIGIPFSVLTPWNAYLVWVILTEILIGFMIIATVTRLGWSPLSLIVASPWLCSSPIFQELRLGQINVLITSGVMAMFLFTMHKRSNLSVVVWGLITGIKLIPVLFFPFLWKTSARTRALGALIVIGAASVLYFLFRPEDLSLFAGWVLNAKGANGVGFQTFLINVSGSHWLPKVAGCVLVLLALQATLKTDKPSASLLALWISVYFLIYNRIWVHHYVLFYLGIALAMYDRVRVSLLIPLFLAMMPKNLVFFSLETQALINQAIHAMAAVWLYVCSFLQVRRQRSIS